MSHAPWELSGFTVTQIWSMPSPHSHLHSFSYECTLKPASPTLQELQPCLYNGISSATVWTLWNKLLVTDVEKYVWRTKELKLPGSKGEMSSKRMPPPPHCPSCPLDRTLLPNKFQALVPHSLPAVYLCSFFKTLQFSLQHFETWELSLYGDEGN